ncbi:uncharacterized protein [Palaemon carinicauda]
MKSLLGHSQGKKHGTKVEAHGIGTCSEDQPSVEATFWCEDQPSAKDALLPLVKEALRPVVEESVHSEVKNSVCPITKISVHPVVKDSVHPVVKDSVHPVVKDSVHPVVEDAVYPVEKDYVKAAELLLAVYIAEHTSTSSVDHLWEIIPKLDQKSIILKEMKLYSTKCARLQKYVIAPSFARMLRDDIGEQFFSLTMDESINQFNVPCLAMSIRYFSVNKGSMVDTFYRFVPIDNAKAETLYTCVKSCLAEDGLDVKKFIGLGIDGASSMVDQNHSLSKLLRDDNPELTLFRCVCHSLHLAASQASECLPSILDFMVRETHSWFSNSPERTKQYQALYAVLENSQQKKVPQLAATRWLARLEAVGVIIDQWDDLKMNFELAASNENCHITSILGDGYRDDQNKLYFLFIRKTLMELLKVNKIFQSQTADVTKITQDLISMYRSLLHMVVNPKYLLKCSDENLPRLKFRDHVLPCEVMSFGYEFQMFASVCSLDPYQINYVKERCRSFVIALINQVQIRLPENLDILLKLKYFHPSSVTSHVKESIVPIAVRYRSTFDDLDELENEWNSIGIQQWPKSCLGNVISFWGEVSERKNSAGEAMFPNASRLALSLLSLPFSNASVGKIFSQINVLHSNARNRLSVKSVEALLQIRSGISQHYGSCTEFDPPQDMLRNFYATGSVGEEEDTFIVLE